MTYKIVVWTEDQEEVKKIMELVGLTPSLFPHLPVEIELPNGRRLEISQEEGHEEVLYRGSWSDR